MPSLLLTVAEGYGNPLQYSCLENSVGRGAYWATVHGITQSRTWLKWLSSSSSSNMVPLGVAIGGNDPYLSHRVLHLSSPLLQFTRLNLMCACVCSVTQSCLTLCDPMDYSPQGYSVCGISQARIFEWVAISYSRAFSRLRDQTASVVLPTLAGGFFTTVPRETQTLWNCHSKKKNEVQKQFHEMQPNVFILRSSCMGKGYIILSQHVVRGVGCKLDTFLS